MNLVEKGSLRDNQIVALVEKHKALTVDQIASLLMPFAYGMRKAQERCLKLHKRGRLKRLRVRIDWGYIYYLEKPHGRIEHLICLNWVYIYVYKTLNAWETLWHWDYEQNYGNLQADALYGVKNSVTGEINWTFVEMDRESGNEFTKIKQYNDLYESDRIASHWWYEHAKKFPRILIVTETEKKNKLIEELIAKENRNGLRFEVKLLKEVRNYG